MPQPLPLPCPACDGGDREILKARGGQETASKRDVGEEGMIVEGFETKVKVDKMVQMERELQVEVGGEQPR